MLATVTVSGMAPPLGVEGQVGALVDRGGDGHRFGLSLFGGRAVSFGAIGLEVAGTAQRGRVVTRDGLVSEDIPLVRLGLSGTFQIR